MRMIIENTDIIMETAGMSGSQHTKSNYGNNSNTNLLGVGLSVFP